MHSPSLLQGIFPTQGSNPGLPHCRWILYQLSHQGSPKILVWVAHSLLQGIFLTQGSNPGLPHCRQIPYQLSYQGISYVYTSTPSLLALPLAPPPHYLLGHHRAPSRAPCAVQQLPASSLFYTWWCVCKCVNCTLSFCHTHFSPSCVHKAVLCICVSIPALQVVSSVTEVPLLKLDFGA